MTKYCVKERLCYGWLSNLERLKSDPDVRINELKKSSAN